MTYTNATKMITNASGSDSAENLGKLLSSLENPEKKIKIIKVYGEAGKSSVCAMLSAVLCAAGYRVGKLVFPAPGEIRESICVYEKAIPIDLFTDSAEFVHKSISQINKERGENEQLAPSKTDVTFAVALKAFDLTECDFAVIEIPHTNISHTVFSSTSISVITHTYDLKIARAICSRLDRNGKEVISAAQNPEIYKLISDKCAEINSRLSAPLKNLFSLMSINTKHCEFTYNGRFFGMGCGAYYQIQNFLTVLIALEALKRSGAKTEGTDICSTVLSDLPFRFETLSVMPHIIIDAADTPNKQEALVASLSELKWQISKSPTVILEADNGASQRFSAGDFEPNVVILPTKGARKAMRGLLPPYSGDDVIVVGSSEYCLEMTKIIKEILM